MTIKKLYQNIKEELDAISYLREKILYPESPMEINEKRKTEEHK